MSNRNRNSPPPGSSNLKEDKFSQLKTLQAIGKNAAVDIKRAENIPQNSENGSSEKGEENTVILNASKEQEVAKLQGFVPEISNTSDKPVKDQNTSISKAEEVEVNKPIKIGFLEFKKRSPLTSRQADIEDFFESYENLKKKTENSGIKQISISRALADDLEMLSSLFDVSQKDLLGNIYFFWRSIYHQDIEAMRSAAVKKKFGL